MSMTIVNMIPTPGMGYYNDLLVWLNSFTAFVKSTYGINLSVSSVDTQLAFTDANTELDYLRQFYITSSDYKGAVWSISTYQLYSMNYVASDYAPKVLGDLAGQVGMLMPSPLPAPPPPIAGRMSNPVGPSFPNDPTKFADRSGGQYTNGELITQDGVNYKCVWGGKTPFSIPKWWVVS